MVTEAHPPAAYEAACCALLDGLTAAFQALQHPGCVRLIGPVVPGATMTFGARVPGTSYQLDPVQAAFSFGTMIGWLDQCDTSLASGARHPAHMLGALLPMADYLARKALAEGSPPGSAHDLLTALLDAHAWQCGAAGTAQGDASAVRCDAVRAAGAATVASMLGATQAQLMTTLSHAAREASAACANEASHRWWLGDASSRGVRIALIALAELPADPTPSFTVPTARQVLSLEQAAVTRIRERFCTSVTAHFPGVQATRIIALFTDFERLRASPINEMVSLTVHN
jgi:2-methylcitrate dehydratase